MTYALLIKKQNSTCASLKDIETYLKTEFKNYNYMLGFLDGYLFDNYKILELSQLENKLNGLYTDTHYIKFITVLKIKKNKLGV